MALDYQKQGAVAGNIVIISSDKSESKMTHSGGTTLLLLLPLFFVLLPSRLFFPLDLFFCFLSSSFTHLGSLPPPFL